MDVDAAVEQALTAQGSDRASDDDRDHRACGPPKPVSRPRSTVSFRNSAARLAPAGHAPRLALRTVRAARAAAALGGERPHAVDEPGTVYLRYSDELGRAGDVPAQAGQRLESGAIHRSTSERAAPSARRGPGGRPKGAQRVRFVDQQQRLVLLPEFQEAWQSGKSPSMLYTPSMAISTRSIGVAHLG